ncbi:hypothetical protein [Thalassobius sp. I31.1]|nr:hypothetical protein [Thalassobius sp. I31.1]
MSRTVKALVALSLVAFVSACAGQQEEPVVYEPVVAEPVSSKL